MVRSLKTTLSLFCLTPFFASALYYSVRFSGLKDKEALSALIDSSELVSLQHRPPASINGLRYRVAADIPSLIKILHSFAYYDANISSQIENIEDEVRVSLLIDPGPQFSLDSFRVKKRDGESPLEVLGCCPITEEFLGLKMGQPALSKEIVNAELNALHELAKCGHPLAAVEKRDVRVDMRKQTLSNETVVDIGPFATFGLTSIEGIENTRRSFIEGKIAWNEFCPYDTSLVQETQERLLKTDLFSSVYISHGDELQEDGTLPINMKLTEARHKKITLGAFYATVYGPGGNVTWTHRNLRGRGESISIKGEYAQNFYTGNITYKVPDFLSVYQTFRAVGQIERQKINPYHALRYRAALHIDREIRPYSDVHFSLKLDHAKITDSANDGAFFLLGFTMFGKYNRADNLLDPRAGYTLAYSMTPQQCLQEANIRFVKQRLTLSCYIPLLPSKNVSLALRGQFGSIAGAKREDIPLTKLFLGGSENELRGYKYMTVSPLQGKKPLGGRSAVYTTAELRFRFFDKIGIVPFADFGTVTDKELPTLDTKWFKSLGLGLRYFAFFGPLRFDIGFPLDKRKGIDSNFQIYASVGQSF